MQTLGLPLGALLTPVPTDGPQRPRSHQAPAGCSGCHALLNHYCKSEPGSGRWWCAFCGAETTHRRNLADPLVRPWLAPASLLHQATRAHVQKVCLWKLAGC